MQKIINRGFTLIELLVVIAIIGILAGIVLASLNSARGGANDAKVQEQLSGFRSAAEVYYGSNGGYSDGSAVMTGTCPASGSASAFADDGYDLIATGNLPSGVTRYCYHNGTASAKASSYLLMVTLPSAATNGWCVDSSGTSKQVTTASFDTDAEVVSASYVCS